MHMILIASLVAAVTASPQLLRRQDTVPPIQGSVPGVATFNNYGTLGQNVAGQTAQVGQNCPTRNINSPAQFLAASGDLSPQLQGVSCPNTVFTCQNGKPVGPNNSQYVGPHCAQSNCGHCYKVTNKGGFNGEPQGIGNSVLVGIVDACPSNSGDNACKNDPVLADRCAAPGTNALDIDLAAFQSLTGLNPNNGVHNLNITISEC